MLANSYQYLHSNLTYPAYSGFISLFSIRTAACCEWKQCIVTFTVQGFADLKILIGEALLLMI